LAQKHHDLAQKHHARHSVVDVVGLHDPWLSFDDLFKFPDFFTAT
jgi:hypothetical protein